MTKFASCVIASAAMAAAFGLGGIADAHAQPGPNWCPGDFWDPSWGGNWDWNGCHGNSVLPPNVNNGPTIVQRPPIIGHPGGPGGPGPGGPGGSGPGGPGGPGDPGNPDGPGGHEPGGGQGGHGGHGPGGHDPGDREATGPVDRADPVDQADPVNPGGAIPVGLKVTIPADLGDTNRERLPARSRADLAMPGDTIPVGRALPGPMPVRDRVRVRRPLTAAESPLRMRALPHPTAAARRIRAVRRIQVVRRIRAVRRTQAERRWDPMTQAEEATLPEAPIWAAATRSVGRTLRRKAIRPAEATPRPT